MNLQPEHPRLGLGGEQFKGEAELVGTVSLGNRRQQCYLPIGGNIERLLL